jgi:predicted Zn-dependent peptidase
MGRGLAFLTIAILASCAPAHAAKKSKSTGPSLESLVREFHLDNGLTLLVVENHESPTIGAVTSFRVGAAEEHPGVGGVTHILEHALFKGTTEIGTKDFAAEEPHLKRIEEITQEIKREKNKGISADSSRIAKLLEERKKESDAANEFTIDNQLDGIYEEAGGVNVNAFTSYDVTAYVLALPSNRLELWMYLESERLRRPVLRQFYTEIQNILEERRLRTEADPAGKLQENFLATAFDAHGYGFSIIGYPSDIESVTLTETEEWFKRYYAPNQVTLAIVGDVKAEEVRALAQEYFGDLAAQPPPEPLETFDLPKQGIRRIEVEYDAEPQIMMGWHKPNVPHPDDAALRVISEILTGGSSGRLTKNLVEGEQIAASISTDHEYPGVRWPNLFLVEALPRAPHTAAEVEDALWAELERLTREPVSERELEKVKNNVRASFVRDMESNFNLAVALGVAQASFQRWKVLLEAQAAVEKVTAADVQRVARATFRKNRAIIATLVKPEPEIDPAREEEGKRQVERMVQALGGPDKVSKVRTVEVESSIALTTPGGSLTGQAKNLYTLPDQVVSEITIFGQSMKHGATPERVWRVRQGSASEVTGEEAVTLRADLERDVFLFCSPASAGAYTVQAGKDANGQSALEVRGATGRTFWVTLAPKTGLPETVSYEGDHPLTGAKAKFVEKYSEYKTVSGVLRPHRIVTTVDGEPFAEASVSKVTINGQVPEGAFEMPPGAASTGGS